VRLGNKRTSHGASGSCVRGNFGASTGGSNDEGDFGVSAGGSTLDGSGLFKSGTMMVDLIE